MTNKLSSLEHYLQPYAQLFRELDPKTRDISLSTSGIEIYEKGSYYNSKTGITLVFERCGKK